MMHLLKLDIECIKAKLFSVKIAWLFSLIALSTVFGVLPAIVIVAVIFLMVVDSNTAVQNASYRQQLLKSIGI